MATTPKLPPGEEPLDAATIDLFLSNMGTDMVLVGGQALAFWMDRFGIKADRAAISHDGDALGKVARAHDLAQAIKARLMVPEETSMTSIVAQLRLPTAHGKERNIDILHMLYTIGGLKKSSEFTQRVIQDSVKVEWRPGKFIQVMEPLDVLESRVQNAVGLVHDKGPHVLTQAKWAIQVASAALLKVAADPVAGDRLGVRIQRIFTLARSSVGKRLWKEHGIEVLDAIDIAALRRLAPEQRRQLDAVEKAIGARSRS